MGGKKNECERMSEKHCVGMRVEGGGVRVGEPCME